MSTSRKLVLALTLTLAGTLVPAGVVQAAPAGPPGPVHAGNTFKWGPITTDYKFEKRLNRNIWRADGPGQVRDQYGMLTLNTRKRGTLSATEHTRGHRVGRWEIRLRSRQFEHGHTPYRVRTELVPAVGRPEHCGADNVALEDYRTGGKRVTHYIRSRPADAYVASRGIRLHNDQWHTFAVEVTRKRISWFVDAKVVSSERRSDALTGVPFSVRFTMAGVDGRRMNQSRMQMDWLRYWTLERPNQKSTKAPAPTRTAYAGGC